LAKRRQRRMKRASRGSSTIGTPNGRGNRNAATVTAAKNGSRLLAAVRGGLGSR